jgi:hypothetical protein
MLVAFRSINVKTEERITRVMNIVSVNLVLFKDYLLYALDVPYLSTIYSKD